ncbi:hypothetical protein ILUMI_13395 [Ignelater luminosus]|uniref:OCIA domain-containing protein n=1 Tax=Ignelater luminosus TaxID=2038154 RepID=A0A8K0CSD5_IGNLU|nr:hypothetical protein ILUMI_13395 [Ignelater luminosus]
MNSKDFERNEKDSRPFPGPNAPRQHSPYKFTPEELRVLKECNKESFFHRCLPISALIGGGLYYGVKAGFLKSHPRYGATPKVILGVVVGYFVGKFSYQGKCAEKLMSLPNSPIGEMLRQRRKGGFQESLEPGFGPGMSLAPFSGMNPSDTYTDVPPRNSLDIDTTRPEVNGLDDSHRPSIDKEMPPVQKHVSTYEELRKKNREEYQQKRTGSYR